MTKNKRSLFTLPFAAIIIIGFSAFGPGPTGPVKLDATSKFISDDKNSSTLSPTVSTVLLNGCPSACTSIWQVGILNISITGSTVNFNTLNHSYVGTGTPPWATYSYLGTLTVPYRPHGHKILQVTILMAGLFNALFILMVTGIFNIPEHLCLWATPAYLQDPTPYNISKKRAVAN